MTSHPSNDVTTLDLNHGTFALAVRRLEHLMPGITLVAIVTTAAYGLRLVPGLGGISPMISAIFVGIAFANLTTVPPVALPGLTFCGKRLLRIAVALLGFQLTVDQILQVGPVGMALLTILVFATYAFTMAAARLLRVDQGLARLLAAGTSICGASAVAAASAVAKGRDEDVAYAIACVTLFGTVAMLLYPVLGAAASLGPFAYGFWTGASVHEVAQVVAAGYQQGTQAGEYSMVVKLSRVLLLAPVLIAMSIVPNLGAPRKSPMRSAQIVPVFVVGFILAAIANSCGLVPVPFKEAMMQTTPIILTAALSALGLGTRFGALRSRGWRPLVLAGVASLFLSSASLTMILLAG